MKNILLEISQEEKNRILDMHKKSTKNLYSVNEQIEDGTIDYAKKAGEFVKKFQGQFLNLYLPGDNTLPIISKFMCDKVSFNSDATEVYLDGKSKDIGTIKLTYVCDGTNIFTVEIKRFENDFLNATLGDFWKTYDVGIDDKWKKLLKGYVRKKNRTTNLVGGELSRKIGEDFKNLAKNSPRPLVEGGIDSNGVEMIKEIQDFLCSTNKSGRPVPKATYASTGNQSNTNMA